jgi:hypothetical protein
MAGLLVRQPTVFAERTRSPKHVAGLTSCRAAPRMPTGLHWQDLSLPRDRNGVHRKGAVRDAFAEGHRRLDNPRILETGADQGALASRGR